MLIIKRSIIAIAIIAFLALTSALLVSFVDEKTVTVPPTTAFVYATMGGSQHTLYAYHPDTGRTKQLFTYDRSGQAAQSLFAPYDADTLAIVRYRDDERKALVTLEGVERTDRTPPESTTFLLSHDGTLLAESDFANPESSGAYPFVIRDLRTGAVVRTQAVGEAGYFRPVAFSSDDRTLWMIHGIDTEGCLANLYAMDTATGVTNELAFVREQGLCIGSIDAARSIAYAIKGQDLGYLEESRVKEIISIDLSTEVVVSIPVREAALSSWKVLASPDGMTLAYPADGATWLIGSDGQNERRIAKGSPFAWSQDGQLTIDQSGAGEYAFALHTLTTGATTVLASSSDYLEPIGWMEE